MDAGDKVRHKTNNIFNGLNMEVKEVADDKILCSYFDHLENMLKDKWFDKHELELIEKAEGGFF